MKRLAVFGMGGLRILQSFFNKQSSQHLSTTKSYLKFGLYFELVAAFFSLCYLFLEGFSAINIATLICAGLTALTFFFELITSLRAMKGAPLALCTMCALGGGIILPAISGIFFFDEPMSWIQWVGVAVFFASAYFLSPHEEKKQGMGKVTVLILVCNFLINGIISIIGKFFAVKVEGGNAALFTCLSYGLAAVVFGIVLLAMSAKGKKQTDAEQISVSADRLGMHKSLYIYGGAVGLVCASIVYFSTLLSRIIPIVELNTIPNAVCLVGSLAIEVIFFKGKITAGKIIGVILNIVSMVIIVSC